MDGRDADGGQRSCKKSIMPLVVQNLLNSFLSMTSGLHLSYSSSSPTFLFLSLPGSHGRRRRLVPRGEACPRRGPRRQQPGRGGARAGGVGYIYIYITSKARRGFFLGRWRARGWRGNTPPAPGQQLFSSLSPPTRGEGEASGVSLSKAIPGGDLTGLSPRDVIALAASAAPPFLLASLRLSAA